MRRLPAGPQSTMQLLPAHDCSRIVARDELYFVIFLPKEKEVQAKTAAEAAQRHAAGSQFLRDHPEFDEFIRLIRSGSISI